MGTSFGSVDALTYNPKAVFRTFPFPDDLEINKELQVAGESYSVHRAGLMTARGKGLTDTYNRFHDYNERSADIQRLRQLHSEMDRAVMRAFALGEVDGDKAAVWRDLAERARPEFVEQEADEGKTAKTRLDWPQAFKDEVLGRLLDLNAERAAAEKAAGLVAATEDDVDDDED